jgi:hypothetical protein
MNLMTKFRKFAELLGIRERLLGVVQPLGPRRTLLHHGRHMLLVVGRLGDLRHQDRQGLGIGHTMAWAS